MELLISGYKNLEGGCEIFELSPRLLRLNIGMNKRDTPLNGLPLHRKTGQ
jgi:hypothetical protein